MTETSATEIPAKPRRRRWWLRALLALLLLAGGAVGWRLFAERSLLAKVRAAGDPVTLEDVFRETIPDDQNAWVVLASDPAALKAFERDLGALWKGPYAKQYETLLEKPLTAEAAKAVRELLERNRAWVELVERAVECPHYAFKPSEDAMLPPSVATTDLCEPWPFQEEQLVSVNRVRSPARTLDLQLAVELADGDRDNAVEVVRRALRLAKLVENEPFVVGRLVGLAAQGMTLRQVHALALEGGVPEDFDALLASLSPTVLRNRTLADERAFNLASCERFNPVLRLMERIHLLQSYDDMMYSGGTLAATFKAGTLSGLLAPAIESYFDAEDRVLAQTRALRVLLAIQRAKLDPSTKIDAAALGLPAEVLVDPFTDKPLVIEHRPASATHEAGWWAYSVHLNGKDDGGKFDDASDAGFGPRAIGTAPEPDPQ